MSVDRSKLLEIIPLLPLQGLTEKYPHWNFRCPICGDSQKSKSKKRGWIRKKERKDEYYFRCFNCGTILSIPDFVKQIDEDIYNQFFKKDIKYIKTRLENKYKIPIVEEEKSVKDELIEEIEEKKFLVSKHFKPITNFKEPLNYIQKRRIPERFYQEIYFCERPDVPYSDMIIFPFYYKNNYAYGFQGRKYITKFFHTVVNVEGLKVFNLFKVDNTKRIYVLESMIDSFFVENSIAMSGADLTDKVKLFLNEKNLVFIFDNDETGLIKSFKYYQENKSILIYPKNFRYKDINEAIMDNYLNENNIMTFISENVYKPKTIKALTLLKIKLKNVLGGNDADLSI